MRHFIVLAALSATAGCERGEAAEPVLTPASRTSPAAERAIEAVAAARCDHAARCNSVGPTAEFMTRAHCVNVMRAGGFDELAVCRLGIDQDRIRACLADLAGRSCAETSGELARVSSCRAETLCVE